MGVVSSKEEEEAAAEEDMASGDTVKLRVEGRCSCRCDSDRSDPNVLVRRRAGGCGVNNKDTEKAPAVNGVSCNNDNNNADDAVNSGRRNDKNDDECVDHNIMYLLSRVIAAAIVSMSLLYRCCEL